MNDFTQQERILAAEFATALGDQDSMLFHLNTVRDYEEYSLRKQLKKVMAKADYEIMVSRGAYYNKLVQMYGIRKNTRD